MYEAAAGERKKNKRRKFPFIKILCALFAPRDTLIFIDQKL